MHELTIESIMATIAAAGFRPTRPRQALAAQVVEWGSADKDFTSEELWRAVQARAPWVGRATTFRTVQLLLDVGFLDRVTFADGTERYHAIVAGEHHHHLTCERCHRVVEVDACLSPGIFESVARQSGFAISGHRFEIFGRCPECQCQT